MLIFIEWKLTYYNLGEQLRTVSRDSPHITDSFQTHIAWFPYDRYDRWKKSSAIAAIIWKPLSSDRSDCSDNDRWDRPQFYLSDRGDSSDHMETTLQLAIAATAKVPGCIAYAHAFQDGCQHKHWESKRLGTFYGGSTKHDCLYNQFSKEYREEYKKINCWKAIGEKFD